MDTTVYEPTGRVATQLVGLADATWHAAEAMRFLAAIAEEIELVAAGERCRECAQARIFAAHQEFSRLGGLSVRTPIDIVRTVSENTCAVHRRREG